MNIHHLELFYYVARHGGISEAVRNIPYGIQQPAVSSQIILLEEFLGTPLFQRRPFALTAAGEELYQFIEPFFTNVGPVADKLRGGISQHIRLGASGVVLRDHLPEVLREVRKRCPKLKLTLRQGYQPDLELWIQKRELDLAVTILDKRPLPGTRSVPLLQLPLVLLVEKSSPLRAPEELWRQDRIEETLISLPANESICKHFQEGMRRLGVDWFPRIEVSSLDLIQTYVANGFGIGLSVAVPKAKLPPQIRALPLDGFAPIALGAIWSGKTTPLLQAFLDAMQRTADSLLK